MVSIDHYLALAVVLFLCGVIGVLSRKNLIMVLMSIELMLNAVNLVFVAASKMHNNLDGQIFD